MRIYYRGRDAVITDQRMTWNAVEPTSFTIGELYDLGKSKVEAESISSRIAVAAFVTLSLVASGWLIGSPSVIAFAGVITFLAAAILLIARRRRTSRVWLVRATYHGTRQTIYASTDLRVFNQVARALCRAREESPSRTKPYRLVA